MSALNMAIAYRMCRGNILLHTQLIFEKRRENLIVTTSHRPPLISHLFL